MKSEIVWINQKLLTDPYTLIQKQTQTSIFSLALPFNRTLILWMFEKNFIRTTIRCDDFRVHFFFLIVFIFNSEIFSINGFSWKDERWKKSLSSSSSSSKCSAFVSVSIHYWQSFASFIALCGTNFLFNNTHKYNIHTYILSANGPVVLCHHQR